MIRRKAKQDSSHLDVQQNWTIAAFQDIDVPCVASCNGVLTLRAHAIAAFKNDAIAQFCCSREKSMLTSVWSPVVGSSAFIRLDCIEEICRHE